MYYIAFILLALAMLSALACAALAIRVLLAARGTSRVDKLRSSSLALIEKSNLFLTCCYIVASAFLVQALARHDFSLVYVMSYTDVVLPLFYRVTAFWAGQAGSMLFWALAVALSGGIFQLTEAYKKLGRDTKLWYWGFYLGIMTFFSLILVTWNNPFVMADNVPADGSGLNPLLQNPGMIFHPPLLFLGYGGFVIPGCLALAQSMSSGTDDRSRETPWPIAARPFILFGWTFLTAGIILGAWWAYMELGWGGYWAWDPVENASLIPWLIATASMHTMILQTRRNKLHGVNVFLMALTTISAFFATFLVRSGVVQSVHAFASSGITIPLLVFIGMATLIALRVSFFARKPDSLSLAGLDSREGFLVLTCWGLLALALIILLGTMWPVFTSLASGATAEVSGTQGGAVGLTADFYNRVCMPLFAALVAILSLCPWLGWNGGIRSPRNIMIVLCVFVLAAAGMYWLNYRLPVAMLGAAAAAACIVSTLLLLVQKATRSAQPTFAAYTTHLSAGIIALAIAFSGPFTIDTDPVLSVGESTKVGNFDVTLKNLYEGRGPGYIFIEAELEVSKNGSVVGTAWPQRRAYEKWPGMQFAEADTLASLGNEFYASLMALDRQGQVALRLSSHPLVNWLWIGGIIMCLLPFLNMRIRRKAQSGKSGGETA